MQTKKLHLGCGTNTPEGWINLDGSWNAWLSKYPVVKNILRSFGIISQETVGIPWGANILIHDVRKPLPFEDNYFSVIYASHLLEHLYLEEAKLLLNECFRILGPNGILRMVVPDFKSIIITYIEDTGKSKDQEIISSADRLNMRLFLRSPKPFSGNVVYRIYFCLKDFESHKWMYDADSLMGHFKGAEFRDVREMKLHQSRIHDIEKIERNDPVFYGTEICVEGIKPN